jgi:hypothetical protein
MGSTDTISQERDSASRESTSNRADQPPVPSERPALAWIALALACVAVVVLGFVTLAGSSGAESEAPSWRGAADAAEAERQAQLDGQARTYGGAEQSASESKLPSWQGSADAAEIERQAHLDGQARTYRGAETPASEPDDGDGFVPGSRRMPV